MENFGLIKDDIYPFNKELKKRKTVRAIVTNKNKEIALLKIDCEDIFGKRNHLETPGGGVNDNEELINALHRELKEEIGYEIKNIKPIGIIEIEYNLLNRIDVGYFFYCEISGFVGKSLEEYELDVIKDTVWLNYKELENYYLTNKEENVATMIHKRDYKMLRKAKELGYFD